MLLVGRAGHEPSGGVITMKLPPTLQAITEVPVPDDPVTGKPFVYELEGATAILHPASIPTSDAIDNWRYELTIAK